MSKKRSIELVKMNPKFDSKSIKAIMIPKTKKAFPIFFFSLSSSAASCGAEDGRAFIKSSRPKKINKPPKMLGKSAGPGWPSPKEGKGIVNKIIVTPKTTKIRPE